MFKVNHLGDAMSFLPTIAGVRRGFPDARITLVCSAHTECLYRAAFGDAVSIETVDRMTINGWAGLRQLPGLIGRLRQHGHPDLALLSHDEPLFCLLAARLSGARRRIGFDLIRHSWRGLLTQWLPADPERNVIALNFDLVQAAGGDQALAPLPVALTIGAEDRRKVRDALAERALATDRLVVLHPFAKFAFKQWPLAYFRELAQRLRANGFAPLFLSAEPIEGLGDLPSIAGLSLAQMASLCQSARLFIGNNSGPMHIAAAMGTPTLILQGPSSPAWNIPWGPPGKHIHLSIEGLACMPCDRPALGREVCTNQEAPQACLIRLTVERAVAASLTMLGQSAPAEEAKI